MKTSIRMVKIRCVDLLEIRCRPRMAEMVIGIRPRDKVGYSARMPNGIRRHIAGTHVQMVMRRRVRSAWESGIVPMFMVEDGGN